MRLKHIVTNPYHLWAHQTYAQYGPSENNATNQSRNRSFRGTEAYSYSTVVACIVERNGTRAYLLTTRGYSVTTARHMHEIRRAVPLDAQRFNVKNLSGHDIDVASNIKDYQERVAELLAKSTRARANKAWYASQAEELMTEAKAYCQFFGKKKDAETFNATDLDGLRAQIDLARKREAKAEREREKRRIAEAQEQLSQWLAGEPGVWFPRAIRTFYLRVKDGTVETSQGATAPLDHVLKVLNIVLHLHKTGGTWHRTGVEEYRLGHFTLNSVTDRGVTVGCHFFDWTEVLRFAGTVGL